MDTGCKHFLRHKTSVISPSHLRTSGIPIRRVMQYPGEYVITHPAAFHSGFNTGVNVAEAVNFATWDWLPWGRAALKTACNCRPDNVRIDVPALERAMVLFERKRRLRLAAHGSAGEDGSHAGSKASGHSADSIQETPPKNALSWDLAESAAAISSCTRLASATTRDTHTRAQNGMWPAGQGGGVLCFDQRLQTHEGNDWRVKLPSVPHSLRRASRNPSVSADLLDMTIPTYRNMLGSKQL